MQIRNRIEALEKRSPTKDGAPAKLVVVTGGMNRGAADAKVKATLTDFMAEHPAQEEAQITIIRVLDEETKELAGRVAERTGKMIRGAALEEKINGA